MKIKQKNKSVKKKPGQAFSVRVSIFYILMAAIMIFLGKGYEIAVYTSVVVLHELAHAEIAQRLGYALKSFRLMPYGASLTGDFEGVKIKHEVFIAIAGPLFNLCLTIPAVALWWLIPKSFYITELFVTANLFIALFNLLPIFPLDGGRVLLALLSQKVPRNKAYKTIRIIGYIFSALMLALFIVSFFYKVNFSFAIVAVFIFVSSFLPDKNSYYQRLYSLAFRSERLKRGLPVREIMVDSLSTVIHLNRLLNGNYYTRFIIVGDDMKKIMTITESELEQIALKLPPNEKIINYKKISSK